jgi:hypothetical protein
MANQSAPKSKKPTSSVQDPNRPEDDEKMARETAAPSEKELRKENMGESDGKPHKRLKSETDITIAQQADLSSRR